MQAYCGLVARVVWDGFKFTVGWMKALIFIIFSATRVSVVLFRNSFPTFAVSVFHITHHHLATVVCGFSWCCKCWSSRFLNLFQFYLFIYAPAMFQAQCFMMLLFVLQPQWFVLPPPVLSFNGSYFLQTFSVEVLGVSPPVFQFRCFMLTLQCFMFHRLVPQFQHTVFNFTVCQFHSLIFRTLVTQSVSLFGTPMIQIHYIKSLHQSFRSVSRFGLVFEVLPPKFQSVSLCPNSDSVSAP